MTSWSTVKASAVVTSSRISVPQSTHPPRLMILRTRSLKIGWMPNAFRTLMPRSLMTGMRMHPMRFSTRKPRSLKVGSMMSP